MATRLVQAGADVLIEKPLSTSLDGIAELQGACRGTWCHGGRGLCDSGTSGAAADEGVARVRPVRPDQYNWYSLPASTFRCTVLPIARSIMRAGKRVEARFRTHSRIRSTPRSGWLVRSPAWRRMPAISCSTVVDVEDTAHLLARHGDVMGSIHAESTPGAE